MLDNSSDNAIFLLLTLIMFTIPAGFVYILLTPTTEGTQQEISLEVLVSELDAKEEEVNEEKAKEEKAKEEKAKEEKEEFKRSLDGLVDTFLLVINKLLLIAGILVLALGVVFLIEQIRLSDAIHRFIFTFWMWRHKTPEPLKEYYLFLDKNLDRLPKAFSQGYADLKMDIKKDKDKIRYASLAFIEQDFIEAFSKLNVIVSNKKYFKTFKRHYGNPTDVELSTVYTPIKNALLDYSNRKKEYHKLSEDTDVNELNTLLTQSFTKLQAFNKKSK